MNRNKTLNRDKVIGYMLVLLTLIASYFFLVKPAQEQETELVAQTATNEQKLVQLQEQQRTLQQEEQLIALEQSEAELLAQKFPPRADATTVTAIVESVAAQSGVSVTSISVESPVAVTKKEEKKEGEEPTEEASPSSVQEENAEQQNAEGEGGNPALGGEIYEVGISITITGTPTQTGIFIQNLETAERTIYTRAVISNPVTDENNNPDSVGSQQISGFTFLLPPLEVTPPPPVSTT